MKDDVKYLTKVIVHNYIDDKVGVVQRSNVTTFDHNKVTTLYVNFIYIHDGIFYQSF